MIGLGCLLFAAVAAVVAAGIEAFKAARDVQHYQPPGRCIQMNGRAMHVLLMGDQHRGPTVILEPGAGGFCLEWGAVQPEVARFARVCAYDRAGYGWSDSATMPRTPDQVASELYRLLQQAGVDGPYVLVGHSIGGLFSLTFARRFPELVAGVVLVDSVHPQQWNHPAFSYHSQVAGVFLMGWLARSGILRLAARRPSRALPEAVRPAYVALIRRGVIHSVPGEVANFASQPDALTGELGRKPLVVLSQAAQDTRAGRAWQALQTDLLRLSANSRQVIATHSGHYIHLEQPELVIEAIRSVIQ